MKKLLLVITVGGSLMIRMQFWRFVDDMKCWRFVDDMNEVLAGLREAALLQRFQAFFIFRGDDVRMLGARAVMFLKR